MPRWSGRSSMDPVIADRSRLIRYQNTAREVPQILRWFALIVLLFDTAAALTGTVFPLEYYLSDVLQVACMLLVAWLISSRRTPLGAAPWLFVGSLMVSAVALVIQQLVEPEAMTLPIMMIGVLVVGGLAHFWGPFWAGGIPLVIMIGATAAQVYPEHGDDWTLAAATGLAASAALLVSRKHSAERLANAQLEIERMATHDPATGLLNRRGLEQAAASVVALAQRQGNDLFVAFFDINGLKAVNDRFGHALGDQVIGRVAAALRAASRQIDLVVRWGGDEFLLIGVGPAPIHCELLARVTAALDCVGLEHAWCGLVSMGIAAGDARDLGALIRDADTEMYSARRTAPSTN